jgi:hypothetical protein
MSGTAVLLTVAASGEGVVPVAPCEPPPQAASTSSRTTAGTRTRGGYGGAAAADRHGKM